jgi:hypothetical protein
MANTRLTPSTNKEMIMKQLILTDRAKEHEFVFRDMGLFHRSEQKFSEGLRTTKRDLPYRNWCEFRRNFGESFLISCYCRGTYCVVTTPTQQYGLLTEELQEGQTLVTLHVRQANVFVTDINLTTGEVEHITGPKLTEEPDPGPPPVPPGEVTDGQHRTSSD